jgi:hypothetical protein
MPSGPDDRSLVTVPPIGRRRFLVGGGAVVLAHEQPSGDGNWLPTPDGPFTLVMRLYLPQQPVLDGRWAYPTIDVVG